MDDFAVANSLREQVEGAGGALELSVRSVRNWFGRGRLTERSRSEIELALRRAGLESEPSIEHAPLGGTVVIRVADLTRATVSREAPRLPPPGAPGPAQSTWAWFRRLPGWAQLVLPVAVVALIAGAGGGGGDGDGGGPSKSAELVAGQEDASSSERAAEEREARRERRVAREKRAREERRARASRRARERREAAARRRAEARREARAAERRRQRELEREREREEEAAAAEAESSCDPSYSGACLDPNASDYDCAGGSGDGPEYADGPLEVVGDDHFDLDSDSDGTGCESSG